MTKAIYNFYVDCGRMGHLEGSFISTTEQVDKVVGKDVYFGECLGKHSEIEIRLNRDEHLALVTDDQEFIKRFEEIMGEDWSTGFNPIEMYFEHNEDYPDDDSYDDDFDEEGE